MRKTAIKAATKTVSTTIKVTVIKNHILSPAYKIRSCGTFDFFQATENRTSYFLEPRGGFIPFGSVAKLLPIASNHQKKEREKNVK